MFDQGDVSHHNTECQEPSNREIVLAHRSPNVAASDTHSFFMCHKGEKECTQIQGNKHSDVYSHMLISVVYLFRSDVLSCALHL